MIMMNAIMMAMKIKVARVMGHAHVKVDVTEITSRAVIAMDFPARVGTNRGDWEETAYEKALMMLDPA
jgi:hypothetical protein